MNFRCLLLAFYYYCLYAQCIIQNVHSLSLGETSPPIVMEIGDSANITCRMNVKRFDGKNSTSLYFTTQDPKLNTTKANIVIVNETTIVYALRNAVEQHASYTCKSGQYAIASTEVTVGTKPTDVTDFGCQAFDFNYMICSFTIPTNMVPTTYNLKYVTQNAGRTADNRKIYSQNYVLNCIKLVKEGDRATCNFTLDDGSYKPNFEYYNFRLQSNNTLGALQQNFTINHKEIVKPAISAFHVGNVSTNSCVLIWEMERYSSYKLNRLNMEVHLQSPQYNSTDTYYCNRCNNRSIFHLPIGKLPYPYYRYNVTLRIKMKMPAATWSDAYSIGFQTLSSAAEVPPAVDVSSFYLNATHLRLFWKPVPEYHRNGSNFRYIIKLTDENGAAVDQPPLPTQLPTVAFPWNSAHSYVFEISSSNERGVSLSSNQIHVPALPKYYDNRTPLGIRHVYNALNRKFTLFWNAPEDSTNVQDYTVFWCKPKSVASNECHNIIGFKKLNKQARNFTILQNQQLVLAVAANYPDFYTGMHWPKCTADASNDLEKLKLGKLEKNAFSITIRWSLERVCASLIKGYTLTYCKTRTATKLKCVDGIIRIDVNETDNKYEITGLEPDTTYKMQIYMYSDEQLGPVSDALVLQTNEAVSTPPRNLTYDSVTSQSVSLTWLQPHKANGKIRYYVVLYNRESHIITCNNTSGLHCYGGSKKAGQLGSKHIHYTLANLSSYTNYTICVKAYTIADSLTSNCIHIQTLIGVPSSPSHAEFNTTDDDIVIHWRQPEVPSGRVEYYKVVAEARLNEKVEYSYISIITNGMVCTIRKPSCYNNDIKYAIAVHSVNIAYANEIDTYLIQIHNNNSVAPTNDELACAETSRLFADKRRLANASVEYISAGAKVLHNLCGTTVNHERKIWIIIIGTIVGSSLMIIAVFRVHTKCKEMKSIGCEFPDTINNLVNRNDNKLSKHNMEQVEHSTQQQCNSEKGRLLTSISKESDYSNDGSGTSWPTTKTSLYEISDNAADYCVQDPMTVSNTQFLGTVPEMVGYMAMAAPNRNMEMKQNSTNTLNTPEITDGYVPPDALQPKAAEKPFTIHNWPMGGEDGYINKNNRQTFNWQQEADNASNGHANAMNTIYLPTVR